jgi:hypothetical protein
VFCAAAGHSMTEVPSWSVTRPATEQIAREQSLSALTEIRRDIRIGETYYRLIGPAAVSYIPRAEGWACYLNGLTGWLGNGGTPEQAFDDLKIQLHTIFQTLLRKRPFEMTEEERSRWVQLTGVIDLLYYKTTTPIITHEIGQVSFGKIDHAHHIEWINGTTYLIDPEKAPGELMSCRTGQWIEAVVRRNPLSHTILEIESIRKINFFRMPGESELKSGWEAMPEAQIESDEWVW